MNTKTFEDYAALVPSLNRDKPKFMALLQVVTEGMVRAQQVMADIAADYDLDRAVGAQLDVLGEWVGIARTIPVPVTGVYFEWGGTAETGWGSGVWQGPFDPNTGPVLLNDDDYRRLIRTKILINRWDGTQEQMLAIWNQFLPPDRPGIIVDQQDMTIRLGFEGGDLTPLQLAMLSIALPLIKPSSVRITEIFSTTDGAPLLSWGSGPSWGTAVWRTILS